MSKIIKIKLPDTLKQAKIYPIGDAHIGSAECNYKEIKKLVEEIKNDPEAYVILNGDLMDNTLASSVGEIYSIGKMPQSQLDYATELLEPIKDKIICITEGNHENRTFKMTGISLNYEIAKRLNIEDRYTPIAYTILISVGRYNGVTQMRNHGIKQNVYSIYGKHGSGGGKRVGSRANKLDDMSLTCDADIFIHSHTHTPMVFKKDFIKIDMQNGIQKQVTQTMVNTASFLDFGGYGEAMGFSPSSTHNPVILLSGSKKGVKVIL